MDYLNAFHAYLGSLSGQLILRSRRQTQTCLCSFGRRGEHRLECSRALVRYAHSYTEFALLTFYSPLIAERGVEKHVELDNLPETEVSSKVASLLSA